MNGYLSRASASFLAVAAVAASPALAQSTSITRPNLTTASGATNVALNGTVFTNRGLVGAGRLNANTRDTAGETLGSFSGMAIDLSTWRRNADGSFGGTLYTLPDRGPNDVGPFVGTTDYRNRVHVSTITLTSDPSANLPQSTASQRQLVITPTGTIFLTDGTGANFTGKDPGAGTLRRDGILYPSPTTGEGAGRISLDAEAIARSSDGSFYVSDEYAAGIYRFDASGRQAGAIFTVPALTPITAGAVNYNSVNPGQTGRRNNQGLEALAITPDNKRLVTILQSATVQDTNGSNQQTRNNTRILVYDISANATPTAPIGHYVLQLPTFNQDGSFIQNRTAAQSEMLALNDTQFLVLARDGIGRGAAPSLSTTPVYKSILLVDTANATNIAGTAYETGTTPVAANGTLVAGIRPVQQVELVNMLNPVQLGRYGMNLATRPSNATSLSEKWEAMALTPVLEEGAPQDFYLFVGNDNDFQASTGFVNGQSYNASLSGAGGTGTNDSVILVYRLSLPTYVDAQALAALNVMAPDSIYGTRMTLNGLGVGAVQPAMRFLNAQRGLADAGEPRRVRLWTDGETSRIGGGAKRLTGLDVGIRGLTAGADLAIGGVGRIGVFGGYRHIDGRLAFGTRLDGQTWIAGGYAALELPNGVYAQASGAWLGNVKFRRIGRASAYGQEATGRTKGNGWAASGEIGWLIPAGRFGLTPLATVDYVDAGIDGYVETGASVSNLVFPDRDFRKLIASVGGEVAIPLGAIRPAIRAGYSFEREYGDRNATVRLAGAQAAMGTANLALVDTERDGVFGEIRIAMREGPLSAFASGRGRWARGRDDSRIALGVSYGF